MPRTLLKLLLALALMLQGAGVPFAAAADGVRCHHCMHRTQVQLPHTSCPCCPDNAEHGDCVQFCPICVIAFVEPVAPFAQQVQRMIVVSPIRDVTLHARSIAPPIRPPIA